MWNVILSRSGLEANARERCKAKDLTGSHSRSAAPYSSSRRHCKRTRGRHQVVVLWSPDGRRVRDHRTTTRRQLGDNLATVSRGPSVVHLAASPRCSTARSRATWPRPPAGSAGFGRSTRSPGRRAWPHARHRGEKGDVVGLSDRRSLAPVPSDLPTSRYLLLQTGQRIERQEEQRQPYHQLRAV
jgi:hypothetical protein